MTAFDALMPGALDGSASARSSGRGGSTGDWRQAVEHAQARSWLGDRNSASGHGPRPALDESPAVEPESGGVRHAQAFREQVVGKPLPPLEASVGRPAKEAPTPRSIPSLAQGVVAMPAPALAPAVVNTSVMADPADLPATLTQLACRLAARPRKQSLHVEAGEQGVSVWVRDTSMNSQQANHLAAAIAAGLDDGGQRLAALYLNGRTLADGRNPSSLSLSSTTLSE